jgi:hypothetical protein
MRAAIGHEVARLVRTRIGPLSDPTLPPGSSRSLSNAEVRKLILSALPDVRSEYRYDLKREHSFSARVTRSDHR